MFTLDVKVAAAWDCSTSHFRIMDVNLLPWRPPLSSEGFPDDLETWPLRVLLPFRARVRLDTVAGQEVVALVSVHKKWMSAGWLWGQEKGENWDVLFWNCFIRFLCRLRRRQFAEVPAGHRTQHRHGAGPLEHRYRPRRQGGEGRPRPLQHRQQLLLYRRGKKNRIPKVCKDMNLLIR